MSDSEISDISVPDSNSDIGFGSDEEKPKNNKVR